MVCVVFYPFDQSVLDVDDFVGLVRHAAIVSHYNDGKAFSVMQFLEDVHHLYGCLAVESTCRFVG